MTIAVHERPDGSALLELEVALVRHNDSVAEPEGYSPLAVFAHDDNRLVGGVSGFTHWTWLFIEHMWVDADHRGTGLGTQILADLEQAAIRRGATAARVTTYGFQTPGFYAAVGYEEFAVLDDYPSGSALHFLRKTLTP